MSSDTVRTAFQNLESAIQNVLRDHLKVIQDVLVPTRPQEDSSGLSDRIRHVEDHFKSLDEYAMGEVRTLAYNHDQLEGRVMKMETWMRNVSDTLDSVNASIRSLVKRMEDERPVEAAEVEVEIEETQAAALKEPEVEEEVVEEVEEKVVEEVEEEEEEEAEEEAEEEESPYEHIFTFEGVDFYVDTTNNNVYNPDEDGGVDPDDVKGIWNPTTEKMWIPGKKKWWDYKTNKYTEPKAKK